MAIGRSDSTTKHQRAVGVFSSRRVAEQALHELRDSGFPMDRVSVITRDQVQDDEIAGAQVRDAAHGARSIGNKADEGAVIGAATGGALGGLTGLLVGLGTLAIPGVGPILLAGATATTLATTLAGGAIGAATGGLLGALTGLGIPEERARVYQDRIASGGYLVIVDGTDEEIALAERVLHQRGIEEFGVYDAPTAHTHNAATVTAATVTNPVHPQSNIDRRHDRHAIGVFPHQQDAESAFADLRNAGFPLSQVALVARHWDRRERFSGADLHDRFDAARYKIPVERNRYYNERLDRGEYLVIVSGNENDIHRAATILKGRSVQDWQLYDPINPDQDNTTRVNTTHLGEHRAREAAPIGTVANATVANPNATGVPAPVAATQNRRAIGLFPNRQDAEYAITNLRNANFPLNQISLVARRSDPKKPFVGVDLHDRFDAERYGVPADRTQYYNDRLDRGDYLVVVNGTEDELRQAAGILNQRGLQDWQLYNPSRSVVSPARPVEEIHPLKSTRAVDAVTAGAATGVASTAGVDADRQAIGVFANRQDAETAIAELRKTGFPLNHTTLITRHPEQREPFAGIDLRERFDAINYGIPNNWTQYYNDRVERGDYLVVVTGTETDIRQAESALNPRHIRNWETYTPSGRSDYHSDPSAPQLNRR
jgi:hypothetical protein